MPREDRPSPSATVARIGGFVVGYWVLVALLHALPLAVRSPHLWGFDAFAFLRVELGVALIAGAVLVAACARRLLRNSAPRVRRWCELLFWGAAGAALLWGFRSATLLHGDGLPIVAALVRGDPVPPYEPLAAVIPGALYRALPTGASAFERAWNAVALTSCAAGVAFAFGGLGLARELDRWNRARGDPAGSGTTGAVLLVLLSQGYSLLFFGYAEHYAPAIAAVPFLAAASLRMLRLRSSLAWPASILALATLLHLGSLALLPAVLALPFLVRREGRAAFGLARDLASLALPMIAAVLLYSLLHRTDQAWAAFGTLRTVAIAITSNVHPLPTPAEWLNVQMLAGPASALFAAVVHLLAGWPRTALGRFAIALGIGPGLATLLASQSNLGYARNWDLIALFVPALTISAVLRLGEVLPAAAFRRVAFVLGTVSAIHTASWVLVFASENASLRRFAALPLDGGQAESTVGFWHALRGRPAEARAWLERAVGIEGGNVRARLALGRLLAQEGQHQRAFEHFAAATRLRPDLAAAAAGAALAAFDAGESERGRTLLREVAAAAPGSVAGRILKRFDALEDSAASAQGRNALLHLRDRSSGAE